MHTNTIFLDRDGTIIEEKDFIKTPDEIEFLPGSIEAIKILKELGYKIIVISNQSGIGRGILTEEMVNRVNKSFLGRLKKENAEIDALYFCPHSPEENCDCRKPRIGLIMKAVEEQKLDLKETVVIGDKLSDVELGKKVGAKTVLVLTGYGKKEADKAKVSSIKPDYITDNLYKAVNWLKNTSFKESN